MEPLTYRTRNYQESLSGVRSLYVLIGILPLPALIVMAAVAYAKRPPLSTVALEAGCFILFVGLLLLLPWIYHRGYRNLSFTIDDGGLTIRFLRTLRIPWSEVISVEKVRPDAIVGARLCGLGWSVNHGLFSTRMGRAWLWLAGEQEAAFLKTTRRNYLLAPERLDEFMNLIESKIRQ